MRPALLVLGYAMAVAWGIPAPLARLARAGGSPQLGLAAWLTAMVSAPACAIVALGLLARAAIAGWPAFARTVCESVTAGPCPAAVYRSAAFELALVAVSLLCGLVAVLLSWRYCRRLRRGRVRTRAHAQAVRIAGQRIEGEAGTFVLDATQPAAYCVRSRPATIVVTSGALAVLSPRQLAAVLAHERAHLAGRHHLLLALTRSLARAAPVVPLFTRGASEVARLVEMRADDLAAGRVGRQPLLAALVAMGAGTAPAQLPASWLSATSNVTGARMRRLAEPPADGRRIGLALAALTLAIGAGSVLAPAFAAAGS